MDNLLIVLSTLGTGGAERVAISYANWLCANSKVKVYIAVFGGIKNNIYEMDDRIVLYDLSSDSRNKMCRIVDHIVKLKNIVKVVMPNVIFTMFHITNMYGLLSKRNNMVLISSERANIKMRTFISQMLYKWAAKKSDGFIFQTERARLDYPLKVQKKSIVIPNAVSETIHKENLKKERVITAMGRLTYQKGFDTLIRAFSLVNKKVDNYKLSIFGDGEELGKLRELVEQLNLCEKVIFNGIKKNALEEIAHSEIFVLSSRFEGMPNALLEAMSIGMACISTDCEYGPNEIIKEGYNGFLVNVDDEKQLADKIIYLIENETERKKIGKNAKKILDTNNPDKIYKCYYDYMNYVYKEKINERQ